MSLEEINKDLNIAAKEILEERVESFANAVQLDLFLDLALEDLLADPRFYGPDKDEE